MQGLPDLGLQMMDPRYMSALKGRVIPGRDVPGTVVPGLQVHRLSSTQQSRVGSGLRMGICTVFLRDVTVSMFVSLASLHSCFQSAFNNVH